MSTHVSPHTEAAREQARHTTGEFGTQTHADPGLVDAGVPDYTQPAKYGCPECAHQARSKYPARWKVCPMCGGTGQVTVDPDAVGKALLSSRDGRFRASRPPLPGDKTGVYGAAYCWRMIRFDTGADYHMPVMAGDYVGFGWVKRPEEAPIQAHLDALVDRFGNENFGPVRMMRGAARWGQALGMEHADEIAAVIERTVGMPSGNGYALGGSEDSPEAFLDEHTDGDGNVDLEALTSLD